MAESLGPLPVADAPENHGNIYFIPDATCVHVMRIGDREYQNASYPGKTPQHVRKYQVWCDSEGAIWHCQENVDPDVEF
jgi:hypothetical protein